MVTSAEPTFNVTWSFDILNTPTEKSKGFRSGKRIGHSIVPLLSIPPHPVGAILVACTAERFFRVDRAQENLHYVSDIAFENLYILECGGNTVPQTPEDETANPSPSSNHQMSYIIPEMRIRNFMDTIGKGTS
ncbi:hypothetical protein NQ318_012670 [Aromia moschata]|uniref:Diacylglycerol kinase iota-like domain-containing protein n=1 Tax=Aromia moschata TaxID=1265417 RepID=A0AAV8YIR2_9CUCU|nr:hypothetical protein NQ318_012670 [Aromia moschata]